MANIVLFAPYEILAKQREKVYLSSGHDVFSYPVFANFVATFRTLPSVDLIITGMRLIDTRGGQHISMLRDPSKFEGRFLNTPIIAHSVDRYPSEYIQKLGVIEFISFPNLPDSKGFEEVDAAVKRQVPDVPRHRGKLAIYDPRRPGSLFM